MESSFDAIYEEESVVPETSTYVLKTTPEERTAPYEVRDVSGCLFVCLLVS